MTGNRSTCWLVPLPVLVLLATASAAATEPPSFASLDKNRDGQLSSQEASARHGLAELFSHYDRNGDDRLSEREYQLLLEDAARETRRLISTSDSGSE